MRVEARKTVESRHTFSINLPTSLYQRLMNEAGKGKISTFIREIIERQFAEKEVNLGNEYRECYTNNPHLLKLAKQ
jgi:hypothetical protein